MTKPASEWEPMEVVFTFTNLATGQRETRVVQGRQRRNHVLTPEERQKYIRFHQRRKAEQARAIEDAQARRESA